MNSTRRIAIVIPCFRVRDQILQVIAGIGWEMVLRCLQETGKSLPVPAWLERRSDIAVPFEAVP